MAKIARYNGDVRAFGSTATGTDRTIFGDVTQSDTLDANLNANFLTGWGILTAGAKPPKQYFNGALYTATQFIAYLHEVGIPEWNTSQKFYIGSRTLGSDGVEYSSVTGTDPSPNTGTNPATVTDETVWKIASNPLKEGSVTHDITIDADYTLTALQNKYGRIEITDTGVLLTVGRNIIVDNSQGRFIFINSTVQTLTVKTSAGTGIAVIAGATVELYKDGINVIADMASALLAEFEVTGAAVTSIDFTGLDINAHKSYRVKIELNNPTGSSSLLYCFANNDTTLTNYYRQLLQVSGAVATALRSNDASIITNGANQKQSSVIDIILSSQAFSAMALNQRAIDGVASNVSEYITLGKTTLQANITQLTFTASVANTIGIGTKIRIYRGDV